MKQFLPFCLPLLHHRNSLQYPFFELHVQVHSLVQVVQAVKEMVLEVEEADPTFELAMVFVMLVFVGDHVRLLVSP